MKRIFHDIEQGTDDWFDLRLGKATASNFGIIMAHNGKKFGDPAKRYAMQIALEEFTCKSVESYKNDWMERGNILEPEARALFEEETFLAVSNGGFMEWGKIGGSADGITEEGLIEIKSVKYSTHFNTLQEGFDKGYQWQIQGNLWIYDKPSLHFISYCPEFPENKRLYIEKVDRDEELIDQLNNRMSDFFVLVEQYKAML